VSEVASVVDMPAFISAACAAVTAIGAASAATKRPNCSGLSNAFEAFSPTSCVVDEALRVVGEQRGAGLDDLRRREQNRGAADDRRAEDPHVQREVREVVERGERVGRDRLAKLSSTARTCPLRRRGDPVHASHAATGS